MKLYFEESGSDHVRALVHTAKSVASSQLAYVEVKAACARKREHHDMRVPQYEEIVAAFERDWERYIGLEITHRIIKSAGTLVETHRLRGADAIHLASALFLKERLSEEPGFSFSSYDDRLNDAARRERLTLV